MCQNILKRVIWWRYKTHFELLESLKHEITCNLDTPDTDNVDFSKPYILSVTELKDSSEENGENNSASQQENESEKLGGKRLKISGSASKTKN